MQHYNCNTGKSRAPEILDTQLEIVHRLGQSVEYSDSETVDQTVRVGEYSRVPGEAIG